MTDISLTDTDFLEYKNQLKTFMKSQPRFRDYDFEGSNLSVILDVLAYNTYQNAFYNNMSMNEWFLDSSVLENTTYSHAKSLNYLPRSKVSAAAKVSFNLNVSTYAPFVVIPEKTRFYSSNAGKAFSFYTQEDVTIFPVDGVYNSGCIDIYEGEIVSEKYFAKSDDAYIYKISNKNVDVNSIRVGVKGSNGVMIKYKFGDTLIDTLQLAEVFYVQCSDGFYEIYFGKNKFGKQPSENDIIEIEYRITAGSDANGVNTFSGPFTISGYPVSNVTTASPASGGAARESISSIKFYAPKSYQIKDRAITENDYEIILKNKFPEIQAVSVLGGEKLKPPQYGKVAVYVDTVNAFGVSENVKNKIRDHLKTRTPLAIEPIILSPEFVFLEVTSKVTFDTTKTSETASSLRSKIKNRFMNYNNNYLNKFGLTVRYSDMISYIDGTNSSILSNQTKLKIFVERYPVLKQENQFSVNFLNELTPIADYAFRSLQSQVPNHPFIPKLTSERTDRLPTIYTSNFTQNGKSLYIRDDGFGVLQIIQNTVDRDIIINKNVGSVDYATGYVKIVNFVPDTINNGVLKIYAIPKNYDIITPKGSIIAMKPESIIINVESN